MFMDAYARMKNFYQQKVIGYVDKHRSDFFLKKTNI